jgi:hypothetical protein
VEEERRPAVQGVHAIDERLGRDLRVEGGFRDLSERADLGEDGGSLRRHDRPPLRQDLVLRQAALSPALP